MAEDRGRVPFALVGVLLLVSSAMLAATGGRQPATAEPEIERAVERADATTATVIRRATRRAARDAARRPVTVAANGSVGRALGTDPFRDALRLRAYLAVRRDLRTVRASADEVTVRARLPPVANDSTRAVRAAIERVRIERAGPNGTALEVTVSNVTFVARRDGRVVDRITRSPSVVVASPVLVLHDRAEAFESRVDAGPLDPGLGRRLTARLYVLAWGRGLAQYGGAPVTNVVSTRHVELLTNGALLRTQRSTLGATDPEGRGAVRERMASVAADDLVGGADTASPVVGALRRASDYAEVVGPQRDEEGRPGTTRASAATAADRTFAAFTNPATGRIARVLDRTYAAEVRTEAMTRVVGHERSGRRRPAGDWELVDVETDSDTEVRESDGPTPAAPDGWRVLGRTTREVVESRATRRTWRRGNETRETTVVRRTTHAVGLAVHGRSARQTPAPARPVPSAFDPTASPVDGPNLADVRRRVRGRLRGRADSLAERAVDEGIDTDARTAEGSYPPAVRRVALRDLTALHREVRGTAVRLSTTDVGTLAVDPSARLASRLRERRAALVEEPEQYGSVAAKASVAVRVAYLDAVISRLDSAADTHREMRGRLNDAFVTAGFGDLSRVRRVLRARSSPVDPSAERTRTLGGPLAVGVETAPAYLGVSAVERESVGLDGNGSVHPLATRNLNAFTLPYGDAADTVVGRLLADRRVRLSTAARTLRSTGTAANVTDDRTLERHREALTAAVNRSLGTVRERLRRTLRRRGVGEGRAARERLLDVAFARWRTPAARALAVSNGSLTRELVRTTERRTATDPDPGLRAALNATVTRTLAERSVRPRRRPVHRASNATRTAAERALHDGAGVAAESAANAGTGYVEGRLGRSLGAVPAGLPVAPVPGYWVATTNAWHVTVRGEYGRLVVRSRRGRPPDGTLSYVRDGRGVRIDVDDDGETEPLGRAERVSFDISTTVVVVVPPGSRGVGDTGGDADERSPGWDGSGHDAGTGSR
ncbi:MAG: hypothetical protein V5A62_08385 [Haloarculaceae archaeon]